MLTEKLNKIRNELITQSQLIFEANTEAEDKEELLHYLNYLDEMEMKLSNAYEREGLASAARVIIKPGSKCGICASELETCKDCGRFIKTPQ